MIIIAIVNRKGGTGKTATAQAMAAWLKQNGHNPLLVDLDSQANLTYCAGVQITDRGSLDVLQGNIPAAELIQHTPAGDLIPANSSLAQADAFISETGKEYKLKEALAGLDYSHVIIDTPAQLGILTVNALTAADEAIATAQADIFSMQGTMLIADTLNAVRKYCNPGLKLSGILVTRYSGRAILSRDMKDNLEQLAASLHTKVYDTVIRECIAVKEAAAKRTDIFTYAPRSNAAADYDQFMKEIQNDKGL